ncbi:D-lactaldehyde dehydrogenase [Gymnopilus junonius]|uniref:D-lactaldehyde dehydrogenase n=1 Tax=Gymnopilus junonius TaxID=109634 RepID=A0A9P5NAU2_GYMJU|nr:D-lactaldehyde dehydrogenase [Gymnopilus junonius]
MPTVAPGSRVLVTGANGYIAMWVVRTLLEQGYTVRGLVRSLEKGKRLREYFSSYDDKLELAIVEDIMKDGAFDESVKGVDAIEHMASPVTFSAVEPDEYISPAIKGTLGILKSALKFGTNVKRIVITSSVAAIYGTPPKPEHVFDETSWGDESVKIVEEIGKDAPGVVKYRASKTLAEKAAWEFFNQHKSEVQWDLVTLHPPFVIGAPLHEIKSPKDLNVSLQIFYSNLTDASKTEQQLKATYNYVDVRDISKAHVQVLQNDKAAGQRIIIANGASTWQEARNLTSTLRPDLYASGVLPRGKSDLNKTLEYIYSPEKGKKLLGLEYVSQENMIKDTLAVFEARGWLQKSSDT